jgi:phosphohistidine phosphatase SixA
MRAVLAFCLAAGCPPGLAVAQSDSAAIAAARDGGVVIVCRHALTDQSRDDARVVDYANLRTQRLLSHAGERQAEAMGNAFRALGIDVQEVIASPMDRARRSAELMFGRVTIDSLWHTADGNYGGERQERRRRIVATPVARGVRLIISHIVTIASAAPEAEGRLEEGDCIVVRPTGNGHTPIGIVKSDEWR